MSIRHPHNETAPSANRYEQIQPLDKYGPTIVPECTDPRIKSSFEQHFSVSPQVTIYASESSSFRELANRIGNATTVALFFTSKYISSELLGLPSIRRLVVAGPLGEGRIDADRARAQGVEIYDTPGLSAQAVAEYSLALTLGMMRGTVESAKALNTGKWSPKLGIGLSGSTVGLVGLGRVGRHVARLCNAFSAQVVAWSPKLTDEQAKMHGAARVSLEELATVSDVVTLHLRLSPTTQGIVSRSVIARMKPSAFLVNTSRADLIDAVALRSALNDQKIAGAALDVFEVEPLPTDSEWFHTRGVFLTPHMAWMSHQTVDRFIGAAAAYILNGDATSIRRIT